jgi:tripartite-type tricarboxylate transporter receptor subunit TctC
MDSKTLTLTGAAAAALAIATAAATPADAQFYKDKTVTVVVGYTAGGGADVFGRLLARHLGDHLPGKPTVIVQNMPGAGGFKAVNNVYNTDPQDGTRIVMTSSSHPTAPKMGNKGARWDFFRFRWLGNLTRDVAGCVASGRSGIRSIEEAKTREIIFGASGKSAPSAQQPQAMGAVLGYKTRVIAGYKGTAGSRLAMEKGEIDATCAFWASLILGPQKQDVASGKLVPIVQLSAKGHPAFGAAPKVYDLARTEEDRQVLHFIYGATEISRPFAAPPRTPEARVVELRKAFWAAVTSPGLKADAERQKLILEPMDWKDTEAAFRSFLDVPQKVIDRAKQVLGQK